MNNNVGIFVPSCSCGRLFLFGHSYGTLCRAVGTRGQMDQVGQGGALAKIQQTKMLVTCQGFGDLFLFGLVWQYSSVQTKYNKGRFKVMATYLQQ